MQHPSIAPQQAQQAQQVQKAPAKKKIVPVTIETKSAAPKKSTAVAAPAKKSTKDKKIVPVQLAEASQETKSVGAQDQEKDDAPKPKKAKAPSALVKKRTDAEWKALFDEASERKKAGRARLATTLDQIVARHSNGKYKSLEQVNVDDTYMDGIEPPLTPVNLEQEKRDLEEEAADLAEEAQKHGNEIVELGDIDSDLEMEGDEMEGDDEEEEEAPSIPVPSKPLRPAPVSSKSKPKKVMPIDYSRMDDQ